jgi:hypothetical protein
MTDFGDMFKSITESVVFTQPASLAYQGKRGATADEFERMTTEQLDKANKAIEILHDACQAEFMRRGAGGIKG